MVVDKSKIQAAWKQHGRKWGENRYVYAVVSRRSRGISIGINYLDTIARDPAEAYVSPLLDTELDDIAAAVRRSVDVPVETYYGVMTGPSGNN